MRRHKILFLASFIFRLSLTARLDMERHSSCHNNPPRASRSTRSACTMQFILRCTRRRRIIAVCSSEKQESDQRAGQSPTDGARVSPLLEWQKQIFNYGHDSNAVNSNWESIWRSEAVAVWDNKVPRILIFYRRASTLSIRRWREIVKKFVLLPESFSDGRRKEAEKKKNPQKSRENSLLLLLLFGVEASGRLFLHVTIKIKKRKEKKKLLMASGRSDVKETRNREGRKNTNKGEGTKTANNNHLMGR